MAYTTLLTEVLENILTITINRPDKLNALNRDVFNDLDKVFDEAAVNEEVKSVIITGAGSKAFVAGADITEFSSYSSDEARKLSSRGQQVFFKIENFSKPVVAVVNGFALGGGCELAMACHFRLCNEQAKFGQPEVNLGLIAGYGGTQRLTQIIGKGKSMEMHMTGKMMDAAEALNYRLVNYVFPADQLMTKAREILLSIHTKAPLAVAGAINAINTACTSTGNNGFKHEVEIFGNCFSTEDMKEGVSAFLEKRKPVFKGK